MTADERIYREVLEETGDESLASEAANLMADALDAIEAGEVVA